MPESCNSRHFSWLIKSCLPNPNDKSPLHHHHHQPHPHHLTSSSSSSASASAASLSSLPDDLLLECLSRVPSSSLPCVASVCRRWSRLLSSPSFFLLRRLRCLLRPTLFALSSFQVYSQSLLSASLLLSDCNSLWRVSVFLSDDASPSPPPPPASLVSHACLCAIGPRIYILGRNALARYDTWTGTLSLRSPMIFPRKKFAAAVHSSKIYVAGGSGSGSSAVEEYDPDSDSWRVVSHAPRRRYGCVGASVDGVFYVIGGLRIGSSSRAGAAEAHVYASSMDLYDVEAGGWLRSRAVPGGGCVVAACSAVGHVYVLASHALELSFWKFDARRKGRDASGGGGGEFGEWCREKSPPLPMQGRLDPTVKFSCTGVGEKVAVVQVAGCIDDLLRRSGRSERGIRKGLVLVYDTTVGEWSRAADLPEVVARAACVSVEC